MKSLTTTERGSVLVIVAAAMAVLIGFAALAVDGGYLYARHTRLQDVDDSMALAAAQQVVATSGKNEANKRKAAFDKAIDYAGKNQLVVGAKDDANYTAQLTYGSEKGQMTVSFPDGVKQVKVDLQLVANLYFARVLGKDSTPVNASATALIGQAGKQTGGSLPIGIVTDDPLNPDEDYVVGQHYEMTLGPSEGSSGNYGWLDFKPSSYFDTYLRYGYDQTLNVGDTVETYTGVDVGLAFHAISDRIGSDTCTFATYKSHANCPRLIYVPIVDRYGESGRATLTILGFAAFFLEDYVHVGNNITLAGQFVGEVSAEDIAPSYLEYTIQTVRLIK